MNASFAYFAYYSASSFDNAITINPDLTTWF